MPTKITNFSEVIGNKNTKNFLLSHLERGTLPNCIIFEGEEGLGKTTLAKLVAMGINCPHSKPPCYKCSSCQSIMKEVILSNRNTDSVQVYNMSVDSGKEAAKLVKSNLNVGMSDTGKRVIICDEAHGMSEAAQDVFLVDMEYLPKDVYLFFCTTDAQNLKKTLKSRSFTIPLHRPTKSELTTLLSKVAVENQLEIQGGRPTLELVADWAECKPRKAINLIEGFGKCTSVSIETIKEFTDYTDASAIMPILDSLSGSLTIGLAYAQEVKLNQSFVDLVSDILTVKMGGVCYKFSVDDMQLIKPMLDKVSEESLITFLMALTRQPVLTRSSFVSALLEAHPMRKAVFTEDSSILQQELVQKSTIPKTIVAGKGSSNVAKPPSLEAILQRSNQVGD